MFVKLFLIALPVFFAVATACPTERATAIEVGLEDSLATPGKISVTGLCFPKFQFAFYFVIETLSQDN
jgi:hypothetical protein